MAANDLLNGFQAGMQAFAPLQQAVLQRKRDEFDTARQMDALRLQAELAQQAQARQQAFLTAEREAGQTFTAAQTDKTLKAASDEKALDRALDSRKLSATLQDKRYVDNVRFALQRDAQTSEDKARGRGLDLRERELGLQENLGERRLSLEGRELMLRTKQFEHSIENPVTQLSRHLGDTTGLLRRWKRLSVDPTLSDFEREEAADQAIALETALSAVGGKFGMMLSSPENGLETLLSGASLFKPIRQPTPPHVTTLIDATGNQKAGVLTTQPNGLPALLMLPQIGPDGQPIAPPAPGGAGGFGATPPKAATPGEKNGKKPAVNIPASVGSINPN